MILVALKFRQIGVVYQTYVPDSIRSFACRDALCSPKLIENDLNVAVEAPKSSESTIRYQKNVDALFHVAESQATMVLNEYPYHDMSGIHLTMKNPSLPLSSSSVLSISSLSMSGQASGISCNVFRLHVIYAIPFSLISWNSTTSGKSKVYSGSNLALFLRKIHLLMK